MIRVDCDEHARAVLPWVERLANAVAADRDLSRLAEIAEDEWPAVLDCVAVLAVAAQQRRAA
jgi:hypothetical protein